MSLFQDYLYAYVPSGLCQCVKAHLWLNPKNVTTHLTITISSVNDELYLRYCTGYTDTRRVCVGTFLFDVSVGFLFILCVLIVFVTGNVLTNVANHGSSEGEQIQNKSIQSNQGNVHGSLHVP